MYTYTHTQTHTHIYTIEYNSAIKKNEILPFAGAWMDSEVITLSKVNQEEKDKYHMVTLICGTSNMPQMNLSTKQTHRHKNRPVIAKRRGWGRDGLGVWD